MTQWLADGHRQDVIVWVNLMLTRVSSPGVCACVCVWHQTDLLMTHIFTKDVLLSHNTSCAQCNEMFGEVRTKGCCCYITSSISLIGQLYGGERRLYFFHLKSDFEEITDLGSMKEAHSRLYSLLFCAVCKYTVRTHQSGSIFRGWWSPCSSLTELKQM